MNAKIINLIVTKNNGNIKTKSMLIIDFVLILILHLFRSIKGS